MSEILPPYHAVEKSLAQAGGDYTAAETHGILSGLLCAGAGAHMASFEALMPNPELLAMHTEASIEQLVRCTKAGLTADDFSFQLLLPRDEVRLGIRAQALGEWCYGFISGLAWAGCELEKYRDNLEVFEPLQDITEITAIDPQSVEDVEQGDKAMFELTEYVRLAVVRIHDALASERIATSPAHYVEGTDTRH